MKHLELGELAIDTATGYYGKVTAITNYLGGSSRIQLEKLSAKGIPEIQWFDAGRVKLNEQ